MDFASAVYALILAVAGGAAGAAAINGINDRWKFKAQREAAKEDKADETADEMETLKRTIGTMSEQVQKLADSDTAQSEALKLLLLDKVLSMGQKYIEEGEITFADRQLFHKMHDAYHTGLHGNGDADLVVEGVDELPLSKG